MESQFLDFLRFVVQLPQESVSFSILTQFNYSNLGLDGSTLNESSEADMVVGFIEQEMERLRSVLSSDEPKVCNLKLFDLNAGIVSTEWAKKITK
jgi:hypothetical protein